MAKWRVTLQYTRLLGFGKRTWHTVEVEAKTFEEALRRALLKTGFGPIRRQLTDLRVEAIRI